ncbi:MAG: AAA family ATPase [Calditrichaeota bacterium]|nr:MAG: AAA family ATPase [Calditrichota bacterium]
MSTGKKNTDVVVNQKFRIRVLIIGAGSTSAPMIKLLINDQSISISAVVDKDAGAPGIALAEQLGISTSKNYHDFIEDNNLDMIINMVENPALHQKLAKEKPLHTILIGQSSAMLIWTMLGEHKKKKILKDTFRSTWTTTHGQIAGGFIIGRGDKMQEVGRLISQVSPTSTAVFIRGESGTGKELVARMVHKNSILHESHLITVNCTALSPTLIESELFGHKKGAFTGAHSDHIGLFERSHNGTLFLDEIGDMPSALQAKLLRFLQSGEIRPIGGIEVKKVNVRIIAATNRDLEAAMEKDEFRMDLFYRLNAFTIHLPPLRERKEDIPQLAYTFLKNVKAKLNKSISKISLEAMSIFVEHNWPGNIRELRNVVERAAVLTSSYEIKARHLPLYLQPQHSSESSRAIPKNLNEGFMALKAKAINTFEYEVVSKYLLENGGNVSRAASAARVPRRTFQRLMSKHKINTDTFKAGESSQQKRE